MCERTIEVRKSRTRSQDDSLGTGVRKSSDLHICILPLSTSDTLPETGCPPPELMDGIRDTGEICQIDQTRNPEEDTLVDTEPACPMCRNRHLSPERQAPIDQKRHKGRASYMPGIE